LRELPQAEERVERLPDVSLLMAMDRRNFIKLTAVTGASATLASCGNPEHQLIRFVPDDDPVPGIAEWKPSVCPLCNAGCGLNVRVMDADYDTTRNGQAGVVTIKAAKKLEGLASHPINRGGLCPRGQAAIQVTYHPDRLAHPMKRTGVRGSSEFKEVSWDEAIAELVQQLDRLAAAGNQRALAVLTRPRRSRRAVILAEFAARFGAPAPIAFELFADDVLRRANALSFGREQLPTFDLSRTRYAVSFGADFLGTWNSPVAQNAGYGDMRQGHPGARGKFVQFESRMSLTGASADEWVPVTLGTEGVVALGLAHVLMKQGLRAADAGAAGALIDGWSAGLADYDPARVAQVTGVPAARIERFAREMAEFRPAVAMIGGAPLAQTNGLFHALAVNALSALMGSVGAPGGMVFTPVANQPAPPQSPASSLRSMGERSTQVLLLDDVNPVYGAPKAWGIRGALAKIPFIASFGSFLDDTSVYADLILPDHSFLESWVDSSPESGSVEAITTVAGPVMRALHETRSTPDVLIDIAGRLKPPVALAWKTAEELAKSQAVAQSPVRSSPPPGSRTQPPAMTHKFEVPSFDGDAEQYPFHFLPYASQAFHDGSTAHLPWLQEMPDPMTSAMWSSWVEVNPQTAEKLHIAQGDLVDVASTQGTVRLPAMLSPGIAPDTVAIPVGQGHETFTRYASGRGVNPVGILAPMVEAETGALAWASTRVNMTRAGDDDGRLIMFAGEMREAPHEHETR
jgi:anaerobic selenocysteine-containing dehydrogenase